MKLYRPTWWALWPAQIVGAFVYMCVHFMDWTGGLALVDGVLLSGFIFCVLGYSFAPYPSWFVVLAKPFEVRRRPKPELPDPIAEMITFKAKRRAEEENMWWAEFKAALPEPEKQALALLDAGWSAGMIYRQTGVNVHYIER